MAWSNCHYKPHSNVQSEPVLSGGPQFSTGLTVLTLLDCLYVMLQLFCANSLDISKTNVYISKKRERNSVLLANLPLEVNIWAGQMSHITTTGI